MPFLYAVDRADDVPDFADQTAVSALRNGYRERHLRPLVPDTPSGTAPAGTWVELVGAAYDRKLVAFSVGTTEEQDDEFIRVLNLRPNKPRFNLLSRNCADFARDLIHLFFPKALKTNWIADLGVTTPKQLAKSMVRFTGKQADVQLTTFAIQQIPGSRSESQALRGVLESVVTSKKYVVPLAIVQPWIPLGMAAGYVTTGRFNPERYATIEFGPHDLEARLRR
jgi:hypothetical protein